VRGLEIILRTREVKNMKQKTINAVICKKFDEWLESIDDESIKSILKEHTIITGGSIASMILNEKVNDYDVYLDDHDALIKVAEYYVKKFQESHTNRPVLKVLHEGNVLTDDEYFRYNSVKNAVERGEDNKEYSKENVSFLSHFGDIVKRIAEDSTRVMLYVSNIHLAAENPIDETSEDQTTAIHEQADDAEHNKDKPRFRPVFFSSNAITLSDRIQLVVRFYGSAEEIHKNFDFLHATNYWTSKDRKVVMNLDAFQAVHNKELIYVGSRYPLCSLFRMRKFISRGFTINAGEILKIAMNVNEFDLTNISVLRDQLVGVDSSYFARLIDALGKKQDISRAYITEIINRMYN
jgi:hypothetical protein